MFDFLFDCSAFEISTTTQAINNILLPIVLFVVIFWLMCEIFLVDVAVNDNLLMVDEESTLGVVKALIDEDAISQEAKGKSTIENLLSYKMATIDEYKTTTELFDIDRERQNLKALGVRKLRHFCKNCKIKGYAAVYNQRGIDGLVEFLLQQEIYVRNIEQQVKHVGISA
jgi:hypothetical protein